MLRQIKLQCQLETGRTACRVSLVNHPLLHQHVETKLHQRLLSCRYFRDSIWQPTKALPQILCDAERWSTLKSRTFGPAITMCNLLYEMNVCLILKKRISFWLHPSKCVLSVCLFCGMIFVVLVITLSICKYLLNSIIIFVRSSIVAVLQVTVWSALYYMSAAWYSAQPHSAAGPQPGPAQGRLNILWIPHILQQLLLPLEGMGLPLEWPATAGCRMWLHQQASQPVPWTAALIGQGLPIEERRRGGVILHS